MALVINFPRISAKKLVVALTAIAIACVVGVAFSLIRIQQIEAFNLAITTSKNLSSAILQEAAHWVWGAGGDFISPNGHQVIFNKPAALQGFKNYFGLRRFISPESLAATFIGDSFNVRNAMVHFSGPWLGTVGRHQHPEWGQYLGIAQMPGIIEQEPYYHNCFTEETQQHNTPMPDRIE